MWPPGSSTSSFGQRILARTRPGSGARRAADVAPWHPLFSPRQRGYRYLRRHRLFSDRNPGSPGCCCTLASPCGNVDSVSLSPVRKKMLRLCQEASLFRCEIIFRNLPALRMSVPEIFKRANWRLKRRGRYRIAFACRWFVSRIALR